MTAPELPTRWANRIVSTADVDPQILAAHPDNWRLHPAYQRAAVATALERLGWIDHIIVNRPSGRIVDGHLRWELALEHHLPLVPVAYVVLEPDEERAALASLDLVRGAAGTDRAKVETLFSELGPLSDRHQDTFDLLRARLLPGSSRPAAATPPGGVNHIADALDAEDAGGGDILVYAPDERGKTVNQKWEDYQASSVRQLVLAYSADEYAEVLGLLALARAHYGVQTNAEAVAALLEDPHARP